MTDQPFRAAPVLERLKDFQRRTVDFVFERLFAEGGKGRFLVADEVGLGKTLVARGVIARALERLQHERERVDVVYVCSNAAIATQNVSRLNVTGQTDFALASRLTLLPLEVHHLKRNRVNFVSFTPATTFNLRSRGGTALERALIYRILVDGGWKDDGGLLNLLQATKGEEQWHRTVREDISFDEELAGSFRSLIQADTALRDRIEALCRPFSSHGSEGVDARTNGARYEVIGLLRQRLAETCLNALKPNLVVLDEFQRFKHLLDGEEQAAQLASKLFSYPGVRVLLLSATPYKMLSLDHEQEDDHYPDFLRTLEFLFDDAESVDAVRRDIQRVRAGLLASGSEGAAAQADARGRLQDRLLSVMCRTERVGMTERLDAMLVETCRSAHLDPRDLEQARVADLAALSVGARETLEYWKSSPYVLSFLKQYDLRRRIEEHLDSPPAPLLEALARADGALLRSDRFETYEPVEAGNARMRALFADTIDRGLWRLLWMPPSLPYTEPGGAYAEVGAVTKALVFSSWSLVPDAIASLSSYEAERRMLAGLDRELTHADLHDQLKPLLRFARGQEGRLTGMPALAWMLPCPTLVGLVDPLREAIAATARGESLDGEALLLRAEARIEDQLDALPTGTSGPRADERWYWAAPALLEGGSSFVDWLRGLATETALHEDREAGTALRDHVVQLLSAESGEIELGPRPDDLARVLAEFAVAGPGTCALRALSRVAPGASLSDGSLLGAAWSIASGFRTLFSLPESIALLRGDGEGKYWRLALQHGVDGNVQALLDEQVHVLVEQLGLADRCEQERVVGISAAVADALSIRTAQISIDELRVDGEAIEIVPFNTRCRFALRFGDLKDDQGSDLARKETVRTAFNSPFRPFVLASTSIGQEGLDFHTWCHAVVHWNLPPNPVDLEQREGRVHRYKGHAVRKNLAEHYGLRGLSGWKGAGDPWEHLFELARAERPAGNSDLVPYWVFEQGQSRIERRVPLVPYSREVGRLERLKRSLALYRLVFGQPRQEDLLAHLERSVAPNEAADVARRWRISLAPPAVVDGSEQVSSDRRY